MVYHERTAWSVFLSTVLGVSAYVVLLLAAVGGGPIAAVDWWPLMLGAIGGAILLSILFSVAWGMIAGLRDREAATVSDLRDRDIARMGGRMEHAFLVIAGLGVILLCAVRADVFWIANVMFAGFAVSSFVGGLARVIAYRRGLV